MTILRRALILLPLLLAGCASNAIQENKTTFLTQDDLIKMTDQMAREIVADQYLSRQAAAGSLRIVIMPVINDTRELIRDNRAELFVSRLRGLLAEQPSLRGKFTWVINRDDFEKLRREQVPESQLGPPVDRIEPEYCLYARFFTDTNVTTKTRSDTYLCQYYITRIAGNNTGEHVWTGQYETSKHIKKEFLD